MLLWSGLLVCILRGFRAQLDLWRLLTQQGLWHFPRVNVCDMAVYNRLERSSSAGMQHLLEQVTQAIQAAWPDLSSVTYARFATAIVALDRTTLDPLLRKLKLLRNVPPGTASLLAGTLTCLFDLRRQQWLRVEFDRDATQNEKKDVARMLTGLAAGTLLLFDLGYFSFPWLDTLTQAGYFFVTRFREKVSYEIVHRLYEGTQHGVALLDALVYLGVHRADRAAHAVRLIQVQVGSATYRYLTNVLDPRELPAWQVAGLYQRRWDIERAFRLLKGQLGLQLLFSARPNVVLLQVFATLVIAQVVLALRARAAQLAGVNLREVSLELLLRWLPQVGADGEDPLAWFVARGRAAGFIRPFRGKQYLVPRIPEEEYTLPEHPPPKRKARYAGKQGTHPKARPRRQRPNARAGSRAKDPTM